MLTILEGIDKVGKTTFCKTMKQQIPDSIVWDWDGISYDKERKTESLTNESETQKILTFIRSYEKFAKDKMVFCDRLHLSDLVYGICERNYPILQSADNFRRIDDILSQIPDVRLILLTYDNVGKLSLEHGKNLKQHYNLFLDMFESSKISYKQKLQYRNW